MTGVSNFRIYGEDANNRQPPTLVNNNKIVAIFFSVFSYLLSCFAERDAPEIALVFRCISVICCGSVLLRMIFGRSHPPDEGRDRGDQRFRENRGRRVHPPSSYLNYDHTCHQGGEHKRQLPIEEGKGRPVSPLRPPSCNPEADTRPLFSAAKNRPDPTGASSAHPIHLASAPPPSRHQGKNRGEKHLFPAAEHR